MAVFSVLSKLGAGTAAFGRQFFSKERNALVQAVRRMGGGHGERVMEISPTRYQYTKFKDDLHFYFSIGIIPLGLIILYSNIFIGQGTLEDIPEGYTPRHWEYYRHPITRFFVKNFMEDPQIQYEKAMHLVWEEGEKKDWSLKVDKANALMAERDDYLAWYYIPSDQGRHFRYARKEIDDLLERKGYH
ncbi:hypothetical protein JTE90_014967 [Oedothorax gibbosus]|uniref:NADH dehydrogenase [ubiquinone] 1 beta subcomplex subunit 5, mitochondrial n=1 Tax=Oedothorax gibbosus TaxID=931172 RepID=A0AAV6UXP4_9ARAC|nr:hypothetical protein JTE90_014967 [Oedothorax gibbosus]